MNPKITVNIKKLESTLDLETLKYGDIVQIQYNFYPYSFNKSPNILSMYFSQVNQNKNHLDFIALILKKDREYILKYKTAKDSVQIEDGNLILFERCCTINQYSNKSSNEYKYYLGILKLAGFIINN